MKPTGLANSGDFFDMDTTVIAADGGTDDDGMTPASAVDDELMGLPASASADEDKSSRASSKGVDDVDVGEYDGGLRVIGPDSDVDDGELQYIYYYPVTIICLQSTNFDSGNRPSMPLTPAAPISRSTSQPATKAEKKCNGPKPATSKPAVAPTTKSSTAKSIQEKFSEIGVKQEETTQKAIAFRAEKERLRAEKEKHKIDVQAKIQMNRDNLQAEAAKRKDDQKFQLEMARIQLKMARERSNGNQAAGVGLASGSELGLSQQWNGSLLKERSQDGQVVGGVESANGSSQQWDDGTALSSSTPSSSLLDEWNRDFFPGEPYLK